MAKFSKSALIASIARAREAAAAKVSEQRAADIASYNERFTAWKKAQISGLERDISSKTAQVKALKELKVEEIGETHIPAGSRAAYSASTPVTVKKNGFVWSFYPPQKTTTPVFDSTPYDQAIRELELMLGEEVTLPSSNRLLRMAL